MERLRERRSECRRSFALVEENGIHCTLHSRVTNGTKFKRFLTLICVWVWRKWGGS